MARLAERSRPKTKEEIEILAAGGAILRRALDAVVAAATPGVTGSALDRMAERLLREAGAEPSFKGYRGSDGRTFPTALCVSVNSAIVHGVPTNEPLRDGDVVGLDLGCRYQGLFTDTATTVIVGQGTPAAERLLRVTRDALAAGMAAARAGATTGDIGAAVQRVVEYAGYAVVRDLTGHGVGYAVHEPPRIPNFGRRGEGERLREGQVIAIEPMVIASRDHRVQVAEDNWTVVASGGALTAHEEHTVAVTREGVRVLTKI